MTADEYLREVLDSQALGDDSDEVKVLQKHRADVEKVICDNFKDTALTIRYAGSKAKGTMNKESYDLDIISYVSAGDSTAGETLEAYLAITDGSELAAQETWRGAMLGRRSEGVDDPDARVRLERGDQVVEQGIRPCDLVIHVHHNRNVDRISWQPRVVRLTAADCHVLQSEIAHPVEQAPQIVGHDIFCDDAAFGSDDRREPCDVISAARADVRNCHPGFDAEQTHELARFVGIVALLLVVPDRAHDVRDRAIGFRKGGCRHARWRHEVLRSR